MLKSNLSKTVLVLAVVALLCSFPFWIKNPYHIHILILMFLNVVYAMGVSMIYKSGSLSFGHAAYAGIGAHTSVFLVMKLGLPFWPSFFLAGLMTAIVATFIGLVTLGVRGIYFTITTFALTEVLKGIVTAYPDLFGGPGGIKGIPQPPGFETRTAYYFLTLAFLLIAFFVFYKLARRQSYFGMICDGLRLNELLEQSLGLNTKGIRIVVFTLSCTFAGFAGSLYAHYFCQINPETFALHMSVDHIVFCAAGGFGSIPGAIIGATFLTVIGEFLYGVGAYKSMVFGAMLIVIILFIPDGFLGAMQKLRIYFTRKGKGVQDVSSA